MQELVCLGHGGRQGMGQPGKYFNNGIALVCWFEKKDQNKRILPNALGKYLSAFMEEYLEDKNKCVISLCLEKNGF